MIVGSESMIERMSRAMARANYPRMTDRDVDEMWDAYVLEAKAALQALMEPTPAMIDRFVSRALCVSIHGDGGWSNYAREQWQAMIRAALEEGEDGSS